SVDQLNIFMSRYHSEPSFEARRGGAMTGTLPADTAPGGAAARAAACGVPVVEFDPEADPAFRAQPFEWLRAARRHGDVFFSPAARGFWVVTAYDLVRRVMQDARKFSKQEIFV